MTQHESILIQYEEICRKNSESFMSQLGKFASIRKILVDTYNELVYQGKCSKIEEMEGDEKRELWEQAKQISSIQERNYLIEVCKALHGFGTWLQLKESAL